MLSGVGLTLQPMATDELFVIGGAVTQGNPPLLDPESGSGSAASERLPHSGLGGASKYGGRAGTATCPGPLCITSTTVDSGHKRCCHLDSHYF
jgi:hypothetical protein